MAQPNPNANWRLSMPPQERMIRAGKIYNLLLKNLPVLEIYGIVELYKIAICLEENIYNFATSQADYSLKITAKVRSMEMKIKQFFQNQNNMNPELKMSKFTSKL